ncbi:MAG: hypothetical protein JST92_26340, partial [Deltaproteobacteria bacterium]|nr:hypothetical protein [Deltaproteobacteria bacterium]
MRPVHFILLAILSATASSAAPNTKSKTPEWLSTEFPLPLGVRSEADLTFKTAAEREFLVFNLLVAGKVAYDAGDFGAAAQRWETLLAVKNLEPEIDRAVRPLLLEARAKAGVKGEALPPPPPAREAPAATDDPTQPAPEKRERKRRTALVTVEGMVSGGGQAGPGGAVITLKRTDGAMPKLVPVNSLVIEQKAKQFVPRVAVVPAGSSVTFRNEDPINHNVFSLSKPGAFDTGAMPTATDKPQTFDKPGVVQPLCNIHASMLGWVGV